MINQAQIAHLMSTCQARFNEMLENMNTQFATFMQNSIANRPHSSSVNIQGATQMVTDGKGYVNWGSDHSILYTHQYVERSQFAAFVSTALTARFTTTAGRDQIRVVNEPGNTLGGTRQKVPNERYIHKSEQSSDITLPITHLKCVRLRGKVNGPR